MVRYRLYGILGREAGDEPFLEKMYHWVAVKDTESNESEKEPIADQVEEVRGTGEQNAPGRDDDEIQSPQLPRLSFESGHSSGRQQ